MKRVAAVLILLSLMLSGCAAVDRRAVESTIREYNDLLPRVYRNGQTDSLANVASEAEVNKVLMYILYLRKNKEIIDSRMREFRMVDFKLEEEGKRAIAETREEWSYRMIESDTGRPKGDFEPVVYHSTYELKREKDGWVIVSLEVEESTAEAPGDR